MWNFPLFLIDFILFTKKYLETANKAEGAKITLWRDLTKMESRKINVASFKHPAGVRKCVFSKGCKYLATYATDGVLRVFMVSIEFEFRAWSEHEA